MRRKPKAAEAEAEVEDQKAEGQEMKRWSVEIAIVVGAALVAASILFIGRWEVAAGAETEVYRLDRWTGRIDTCVLDTERLQKDGTVGWKCPMRAAGR